MVDLTFAVEGAVVDSYAAAPSLLFKLCVINETPDVRVENVVLHCQIRIEATRRTYAPKDRERLIELFGITHRWKDTLQSMLWTHTNVQVPAFDGQRIVEMPVPCSFDFNVAATKYFFGLEGGEVPLAFLFSGTVFYRDAGGFLQMDLISWSKEANYRLPVRIWQELMDFYYPNTAWLRIDRDVFEEIYRYKRENGFTGWDETLRALLTRQREESLP
ncbi:MAG: DUF6084 family protein [Pseudomonadota bacterium]|nr:DUF6084 family protein [Pseudomonadota bacterium]